MQTSYDPQRCGRSPLLACAFGLCITLRYIATTLEAVLVWDEDEGIVRDNGSLDLVGFSALAAAFIALVMTAARLLVVHFPNSGTNRGATSRKRL